jgi:hypothetical protein
MTISLVNGVNPLQTTLLELGIVSGRVALLLRSAEIQPLFGRFVSNTYSVFTPYSPDQTLLQGVLRFRVPCTFLSGGQGLLQGAVVRVVAFAEVPSNDAWSPSTKLACYRGPRLEDDLTFLALRASTMHHLDGWLGYYIMRGLT